MMRWIGNLPLPIRQAALSGGGLRRRVKGKLEGPHSWDKFEYAQERSKSRKRGNEKMKRRRRKTRNEEMNSRRQRRKGES